MWAETCQAAERRLAEALARRLTAAHVPYDGDNVAARTRLAFAAAVASAAVRTAMENWAAGEGPSEGPGGPVELTVANLRALRDFPWGEAASGGD